MKTPCSPTSHSPHALRMTCALSTATGLATLLCLSLAGCGGGSSGSAASISNLKGTVVDGYIEGATVCLDLNANQSCDKDEPSATTAKDGSYTLDTSKLGVDQIKAAHLLTVVPDSAKDADDVGKTLKEVGKSGFSLLAPTSAYTVSGSELTGAIISPLTTLVSHEMISGNNLPLADAQKNVVARLSLPSGTDLTQDFVSKKNATLADKAQMVAMTIAEVKKTAQADATTKPTEQQSLLAALSYMQTQAEALQTAYASKKTSATTALQAVQQALKTTGAIPNTATLVGEAKKMTGSTVTSSLESLLQAGFYGSENVLEICSSSSSSGSSISNCSTPRYWKIQGSAGKFSAGNNYVLSNGAWTKDTENTNSWRMGDTGWVSDGCTGGTYTIESASSATINCSNGWQERVSARTVDASGKTLSELGLKTPAGLETATMPAGAQLTWSTFANLKDGYYLNTYSPVQYYDSASQKSIPFTSLQAFIDKYRTPASATSLPGTSWAGLRFSFDNGDTATGGTVTLWNDTPVPVMGYVKLGSASFERRTVSGQEVLIIQARVPYYQEGRRVLFAVKDGVLYDGTFEASTMARGSEAYFNKVMMNALLVPRARPVVVD